MSKQNKLIQSTLNWLDATISWLEGVLESQQPTTVTTTVATRTVHPVVAKLEAVREQKNWSSSQMGKAVGLSASYWRTLANGHRQPSETIATQLEKAYSKLTDPRDRAGAPRSINPLITQLREWRVKNKMTQKQMAITLGINVKYYEKLEMGLRSNPSKDLMARINEVMGQKKTATKITTTNSGTKVTKQTKAVTSKVQMLDVRDVINNFLDGKNGIGEFRTSDRVAYVSSVWSKDLNSWLLNVRYSEKGQNFTDGTGTITLATIKGHTVSISIDNVQSCSDIAAILYNVLTSRGAKIPKASRETRNVSFPVPKKVTVKA